jgi:transposase
MDFFQYKALLHARLPRVLCPEHGVRQVSVSWARPGSGFTMLFEALALTFAKVMPVAKVAELTREHDTRIWRVLEHHVGAARDQEDFSAVTKVGMDETSARKGQDYVSIFADMMRRRVLFATEGRDAATVARFATDLAAHGGDPKTVTDTSSDMSTAFISGIGEHLPNATMTFDRFHLAAKLSEAVDAVRRAEVTTRPELKHTRWLCVARRSGCRCRRHWRCRRVSGIWGGVGRRGGALVGAVPVGSVVSGVLGSVRWRPVAGARGLRGSVIVSWCWPG